MTATVALVGLVIPLVGAVITVWLLRRLWRREGVSPMKKGIAVVLSLLAGAALVGTAMGWVKALSAIDGDQVDPSQKARVLAEGISEAITAMAFGLAVCLVTAGVLVVMIVTRPKPK